jgi:hypothetical protein
MSIPEFYIQPFSAVDTDRVDVQKLFFASVWWISASESAPSFVRLFRFLYNISETARPVLTNINGGGGAKLLTLHKLHKTCFPNVAISLATNVVRPHKWPVSRAVSVIFGYGFSIFKLFNLKTECL